MMWSPAHELHFFLLFCLPFYVKSCLKCKCELELFSVIFNSLPIIDMMNVNNQAIDTGTLT